MSGAVRSVNATDGARLEYEVTGAGPALVLLHGFLTGRSAFSRQRAPLAARFRLIVPSGRGHDGSDGTIPPGYGVGTSDVDDLETILAAEQIGRFRVLGHSSGGATGFAFARRHPDRVSQAILIEPTLYGLLPSAERDEIVAQTRPIIEAAATQGPAAALRETMAAIGGDAWINLERERKASRLESLAARAPLIGPHFQGLLDFPVTEADVVAFRPASRLFYGAGGFPFEASIAARFRALRPDFPVISVAGAGHNVHRDQPGLINAEALAFLTA